MWSFEDFLKNPRKVHVFDVRVQEISLRATQISLERGRMQVKIAAPLALKMVVVLKVVKNSGGFFVGLISRPPKDKNY